MQRLLSVIVIILAVSFGIEAAAQCPGPPSGIVINELMFAGATDGAPEFLELLGPADTVLDCYELRAYNGGSDALGCELYETIALTGAAIPASGYYTICAEDTLGCNAVDPNIDLQNGPDLVVLVYVADAGDVVVDSLTYGGQALTACDASLVEGNPAADTANGESVGRCPDGTDTGNNGADFATTLSLTPGAANDCPEPVAPCTAPATGLVINEVLYAPATGQTGFIELAGPEGTAMHCYKLVGVNGNGCAEYTTIDLEGELDETGFYLVAEDTGIETADLVDSSADLQNGADAVMLVFTDDNGTETVVDGLHYPGDANDVTACMVGEGGLPAEVDGPQSLTRIPDGLDTDDNAVDFVPCDSPSPKALTTCTRPEPCVEAAQGLVINEVHHSPATGGMAGFIELYGPAGVAMDCYTLEAVNGSSCEVYTTIELSGVTGEDGYYLVAEDDSLEGADLVVGAADLQNGSDAVRLVFTPDQGDPVVVDAMAYLGDDNDVAACGVGEGTPAPDVESGQSLARVPDGADTGDNAADFAVCDTPSPGSATTCAPPIPCDAVPTGLMLNEILAGVPTESPLTPYVEVYGPAGTSLHCVVIRGINGGSTGDTCQEYAQVALQGAIPEDGYFVVTKAEHEASDQIDGKADLQNGPDVALLVYTGDDGDVILDAIGYGEELACEVVEGKPEFQPATGESVARMPDHTDTDDNRADCTVCTTPTPGAANDCPYVEDPPECIDTPVAMVVNEFVVGTATGSETPKFVEIKGPAGTSLECYQLWGINGSDCEPYAKLDLEGLIPDDGYFVAASSDVAEADQVSDKADFQGGPDSIQLVYVRTDTEEVVVVDEVAYGGQSETCTFGEGAPLGDVGNDLAGSRMPDGTDTDDNASDFQVCASPTPGIANTCTEPPEPTDTDGPPTGGKGDAGSFCMGSPTMGGSLPALALLALALVSLVTIRRRREDV